MIVLKHNDVIYVAKSCWSMRDPEARRAGIPDEENLNMWHPGQKKDRLIAVVRNGRFSDAIRYENVFPSVFEQKHLVFETYERIQKTAERFGLCDNSLLPSSVVLAEGDTAYVLYEDGAQIELEHIYAATCNDEAVMALYDLKGLGDPYAFFKEAFLTLEETRKYVMFPVTVMNTKNNRIEVIRR